MLFTIKVERNKGFSPTKFYSGEPPVNTLVPGVRRSHILKQTCSF